MAVQLPSQNTGDTSVRGQVQNPSQIHSIGPEVVRSLKCDHMGEFPPETEMMTVVKYMETCVLFSHWG